MLQILIANEEYSTGGGSPLPCTATQQAEFGPVTPALSYSSSLPQTWPFANQHLKHFWKDLLNLVLMSSQLCPCPVFPLLSTTQVCLGSTWHRYLPRSHHYWLSPHNKWVFGWSHTAPSERVLASWAEWLNERLTLWPLKPESNQGPRWVPASQYRALPHPLWHF